MNYSIIIPVLNEAPQIESCLTQLQSLRGQAEIIVVDGGSKDKTVDLAQPFADKVVTSPKGRAKQMNTGAKLACGRLLIFLHADTFLPNKALNHIDPNQKQWGRFDIKLEGYPLMLKVIACFMNWRSRLTGIATGDQVIFVSKSLFSEAGGYPEIALMEDISLCSVLKKFSRPLCLNAKVKSSGRRWVQFGVTKTILLMWSLRLRYFFGEDPAILSSLYTKGQFWKT